MIDQEMASRTWAMREAFSLADCAAAPALFYANEVLPFGDTHHNVAAYFNRLKARPSYARVLREAEPVAKKCVGHVVSARSRSSSQGALLDNSRKEPT
jgi:glutathione S-transferase